MSDIRLLSRDDAPFGDGVWDVIDNAVRESATRVLGVRRLLHTDGPFGSGMKSLPGRDRVNSKESSDTVSVSAASVTPLSLLSGTFALPMRDVVAYEESGTPLDLSEVVGAAKACAAKEDALLLWGAKSLGVQGLMNASGTQSSELRPWREVGDAVEDVIEAVDILDRAGFHGPYSLGLAPQLYNRLFRRYPQGNTLELEHLRSLVTDGIVKIATLESGGILLASGRQYATVALGEDLLAGFEGPEGQEYRFIVSESLALWLKIPQSIVVLKSGA